MYMIEHGNGYVSRDHETMGDARRAVCAYYGVEDAAEADTLCRIRIQAPEEDESESEPARDIHYHVGGTANCPACMDYADYLADQEEWADDARRGWLP